ncbi:hypothetical protein BH10PLA2_BH10PLA2_18190 [soil metagenome]
MKLFYFLQELKGVALGYDFRLFTYGPFDSEVLSDLATACSLNQVKESPVTYSRGYGFDITAGPHADRLSCELETNHSVICSEVDAVIQDFGSFGAAELELRSTVLFVDREFCQVKSAHTSSEIFERVRQIKPHFSDTVIQERISEMKGKGWLQSIASS